MASDTRQGFRLPWTAAAGEDQDPSTASEATTEPQVAEGVDSAGEAPGTVAPGTEATQAEATESADGAEATATPDTTAEAETAGDPPNRRATKFMADLSRAMQAASENARSETMARFEVEAKSVIEAIHANATNEAADVRRRADDDVAAVRDWSKAEISRIREETEERIAARKTGLDVEIEQHAASVEARTERVAAVVAAFESQMAAFFEQLNAEEDPTRIATMAETMPDPPSLADEVASVAVAPASPAEPVAEPPGPALPASDETATGIDFAAAEAEAASFSGDLEGDDDEVATAEAQPVEGEGTEEQAMPVADDLDSSGELAATRIVVAGLVSVANIANFKRSLTRTSGVATIAVASGPDGDFVFTVGHSLGAALSEAVQVLPGFDIQITNESGDAINVAAQDREASD